MKWLKHYSDAYSNLKMQQLLARYGTDGYGFFWICSELVAQQGAGYRIGSEKKWKTVLSRISGKKIRSLDEMLQFLAEVNLIDRDALQNGDLYLPKMGEYADEYTQKVRLKSGHYRDTIGTTPDFVGLEQNRTEQNRTDASGFAAFWAAFPKKKNRQEAETAWLELFAHDSSRPDTAMEENAAKKLQAAIYSDVYRRKQSVQWTEQGGRFVPQAAKYLTDRQWEDSEAKRVPQSFAEVSDGIALNSYKNHETA